MGSLLWLLRTRYDLSFRIIGIGVRLNDASKTVGESMAPIKEIHRVIRVAMEHPVAMHYGRLPLGNDTSLKGNLAGIRIFVRCGAGFSTLPGQQSIESRIIVAGRENSRDGRIKCMGSPIDYYVKQIARFVRSTIEAESAAAGNASELGIWHLASLSELISGRTFDYRLQTEDARLLRNPGKPFCAREHIELVLCSAQQSETVGGVSPQWVGNDFAGATWSPMCDSYRLAGKAASMCNICSVVIPGGAIYLTKEDEIIESSANTLSGEEYGIDRP